MESTAFDSDLLMPAGRMPAATRLISLDTTAQVSNLSALLK
jgi:hypothetical protein